jgi:hypothetical protein
MLDLVVGERCAEPLGLGAMIWAAARGSAFAVRPVDDDVALVVVGVERIPVTLSLLSTVGSLIGQAKADA